MCTHCRLTLSGDTVVNVTGQPTESALLVAAHKLHVADRRGQLHKTHEEPFSSESKIMKVSYSTGGVESGSDCDIIHCMKGAVETVLPQCTHYLNETGEVIYL